MAGLDRCKKDDLVLLAEHFGVTVLGSNKKATIRQTVFNILVAEDILKHVEVPDSMMYGVSGSREELCVAVGTGR